ncbi:ankycorbin-like [Drosophila guanche]|uniref:Blast:Myosin heavy chain, striated muscle n=1 Tax=Drosophila guanche TaxID=7266 RepID=A0A3B0JG28_DROGU|nr:ankycorbin-like [Drosophila guanche]SPP79653.1 blast:Myosin heavy chain%2C striated muscle [Drosophila guanche]
MEKLLERNFFELKHVEDGGDSTSCAKQQEQMPNSKLHDQEATEAVKKLDEGQPWSDLEEQLQQAFQEKHEHSQEQQKKDQKQLEGELQRLKDQLDGKQREFEKMTKRYNALESAFEATLLKKNARICELKGSLDLAQDRCDEVEQENERELEDIKQLKTKILTMEHANEMLMTHFEAARLELSSINDLLLLNENQQLPDRHLSQQVMQRSLESLQAMTEYFEPLQQQLLEERNKELGKLTVLKEDKSRLAQRLANMQKELALKASNYATLEEQIQPLIDERDALREQLQKSDKSRKRVQLELQREQENSERLIERLHRENHRLELELQSLQRSGTEKEEAEVSANCSNCVEKLNEIRKLQKINKRQRKLLKEFKGKAEQLKAYTQAKCPTQSAQQCSEQLEQQKYCERMAEQENIFHAQLQQAEEKYQRLQSGYEEVCGEIVQLKQTIVRDREKIAKVVCAKNSELNALMSKCRSREQCIDELKRGFDEAYTNIGSERQSMKRVMAQWEASMVDIKQVEKHWQQQMSAMQRRHDQAMDTMNQRYQNAIQKANNCKLYAEDKATEYQASLAEMKATMDSLNERYQTAMQTANNYKLFSDDKATEYQASLGKMKATMKHRQPREQRQ